MKLISVNLPDNHNIFHFGDKHSGSVLSSQKGWNKLIDMMTSEFDGCSNNYGIDGGDMIEAITPGDKRYNTETSKEDMVLDQIDIAVREREAIAQQLLAILMGNHELTLWGIGNITQKVCDRLNVPYGTYSTKLTINDIRGNLMYKIYETHGRKSINSTADDPKRRRTNMELTLKRHLKFKAADCAVMVKHHVHKLIVCKPDAELYLTDDGKQITQNYTHWGQGENYIHPDARWYGCAGSFLKLFGDGMSGYAEMAEYDPTELGFLVTKVRDKKIVEMKPVYLEV